ncbi:hypothetical protein EMIT0111MI5_90225 [Burkholderia sp. IT-111MI5]
MDVREPNGTVCRNLGSDRLLSALHVHKWLQLGSWSADETHWGLDIQRVRRNGSAATATTWKWTRCAASTNQS